MIVSYDPKDRQYLHIEYEEELEAEQLQISFTKKIRNWRFRTKHSRWNGDVTFLKGVRGTYIPIGLWKELKDVCDRFGFKLKTKGYSQFINKDVESERVREFCLRLTEHLGFQERESQIDSVYKALKYRYCMLFLATSAGKTLIEYMIAFWLFYHKEITRVLIVCPDADLVMQGYADFLEYAAGKWDLKMCMVHGGTKVHDIQNNRIIIGNFQTLSNRPPEFFEGIDCVMIDECHRAKAQSIQYVFEQCKDAKYRVGLSGTIKKDDSADYYQLLASLGPIVRSVKKKELMDKGHATPVEIQVFKLNYASDDARKFLATKKISKTMTGSELMNLERKMVRESKKRLEWVVALAGKLNGNTLIFFHDKKGGYGRKIVERLKRTTNGKEIYYIDGDTKKAMRESIKKKMGEGSNKYLVASYPVYSTGKSIPNLYNFICAESVKGYTVLGQAMGRGMRLIEGKEKFMWFDIVDDFSISDDTYNYTGYMVKHWHERRKHYDDEGFDYRTHDIDLIG